MPVGYKIDVERGIVFSRASCVVTDDELLRHQMDMKSDADFQTSLYQLFDYSDVAGTISTDTVKSLTKNNPFGAGSRPAIVSSQSLGFGMNRMFQSLTDRSGHDLQIFRDIEPAMEWLGVKKSPF
jgi:hypothetical protein